MDFRMYLQFPNFSLHGNPILGINAKMEADHSYTDDIEEILNYRSTKQNSLLSQKKMESKRYTEFLFDNETY